jgi:predicted ester cyclase
VQPLVLGVGAVEEQERKVVARVVMHGRHVGEFLGQAPTGKEFATMQIHVWRIEEVRPSNTGRFATTSARRFSSG